MPIGFPTNTSGGLEDFVDVPYDPGTNTIMAHLNTNYYHVHGAAFIYPDKADPITVTSSAAAWSETGTIVEIIPADTITKAFDIHWCSIADISAVLYGMIDLYKDTGGVWEKIGPCCDVVRNSNFTRENWARVQIPQQEANTKIGARFSDSTSSQQTVKIKLIGHVYSTSLT